MSDRVVVIGSGMGGLVAAILLARQGRQVTVLERHTRYGGFLHRFFRRGLGYDTGFHYVGSAGPDQLFGLAMKHLGVRDQLEWKPLDPDGYDILRFPDFEVSVPVGADRYRDRLIGLFPHEREGITRYFELHARAKGSYGWFNLDPTTPANAIVPWEEQSLADVTRTCFTDPRLAAIIAGQAALYGVPPQDAPFGLHAIVTDHFLQGAWSIGGGGDRLARVLVKRLRALGGEVRLATPATAIEVQDGRAVAVHTPDDRLPADLVFADIHPRLVLDLLPPGAVRPAYATRVRETKPGLAHLGIYLRVAGDLGALGNRNLYRFASWDLQISQRASTPEHVPFHFMSAPGFRTPAPVPGGDQVVLGLVFTEYETFRAALEGGEKGPRYRDLKERVADAAVRAMLADYPGWTVLDREASTPLTTERYNSSPSGAAYGHYHSVAQMGRYRLPAVTKVRGLVQVGQSVSFPGICGAMMSAYVAVGEMSGAEGLMRELRDA